MGGNSGGGTTQVTTNNSAPWAGSQPFLLDLMNKARQTFEGGTGQNYFPGSTVVPFSNQTNQALQMRENRANAGSPVTNAAQTLATQTLGGNFLDPANNPAFRRMAEDITNRTNAQFSLAGRTGSPAHAESIARGITQGGAGLYDAERARMMQALGMAGEVGALDLQNIDLMGQAGAQREALAAQQLQDLITRYGFTQTAPWDALRNYSGIVSGFGGLGGTGQTTQTGPGANRGLTALSGAASGAALGGIPGFPGGVPVGAALGGLLGLF